MSDVETEGTAVTIDDPGSTAMEYDVETSPPPHLTLVFALQVRLLFIINFIITQHHSERLVEIMGSHKPVLPHPLGSSYSI